jgi:DNA-binding transcriptional regulator YhcF (GntR family)
MAATYERIADLVEHEIRTGTLRPGDLIPSTRRLVADHGVAMATATRVIAELQRRGLVAARRGVGTVVLDDAVGGAARGTVSTAVTTADVVRAAVRLADAEGLGGLSMRRIAADVGLPTMSVYRHVSSRDDLLTRMLDHVYGEAPLPTPLPAAWRDVLETCARAVWGIFQTHPWAAHAMSTTRPQATPNAVAYTEALLQAFSGTHLDVETTMHLAVGLFQFVRGIGVSVEPAEQARQDSGMTDEEWMRRAKPTLLSVTDEGRHPHLTEAIGTEIDLTLDSLFEFGLARLLDGYEVFLAGAVSSPEPLPLRPPRRGARSSAGVAAGG